MNRKGKRPLDSDGYESQPNRKKPASSSEAANVDAQQKCTIEATQKISEELALLRTGMAYLTKLVEELVKKSEDDGRASISRASHSAMEGSVETKFSLKIMSPLNLKKRGGEFPFICVGDVVKEEGGELVRVKLVDATGQTVRNGLGSGLKLDVVVIDGGFNDKDDQNRTNEFNSKLVKERKINKQLLIGVEVKILEDGIWSLGELKFTDNSSWTWSRKFRIGVRCDGVGIREAVTEPFAVKELRRHQKHYPPEPDDEVWRLENIAKDGKFHIQLTEAKIFTVKQFVQCLSRDPKKIDKILESMLEKNLADLKNHAKKCKNLSDVEELEECTENKNFERTPTSNVDNQTLYSQHYVLVTDQASTSGIEAFADFENVGNWIIDPLEELEGNKAVAGVENVGTLIEHSVQELPLNEAEIDWLNDILERPSPAEDFERINYPASRKAAVAWLKIKAVFNWGIFVRRPEAQKRGGIISVDPIIMIDT